MNFVASSNLELGGGNSDKAGYKTIKTRIRGNSDWQLAEPDRVIIRSRVAYLPHGNSSRFLSAMQGSVSCHFHDLFHDGR